MFSPLEKRGDCVAATVSQRCATLPLRTCEIFCLRSLFFVKVMRNRDVDMCVEISVFGVNTKPHFVE